MEEDGTEYQQVSEVVVGKERTKFIIHTKVFRARSTFFKSALSTSWNLDQNPVEFVDVDPGHFSKYLTVAYGGTPNPNFEEDQRFLELSDIYILADRLGECTCANLVMDAIIEHVQSPAHDVPDWSTTKSILTDLPTDSCMHRLMVDAYCATTSTCQEVRDDAQDETASKFLVAVAQVYRTREAEVSNDDTIKHAFTRDIRHLDRVRYHEHNESGPKDDCVGCKPPKEDG
ncbi:uncharacterized protein LTR77_007719 [Saxophila tyrrhenica]|uniref:BTB domain-containing protein n=1 Tax=Saxophila tyrrhenica TaxID=1690608 RepID=A0AAV9P5P1_9PEZI|nr:hypothetical protein LTR77_007719 [Saxophila tyrrhenica]